MKKVLFLICTIIVIIATVIVYNFVIKARTTDNVNDEKFLSEEKNDYSEDSEENKENDEDEIIVGKRIDESKDYVYTKEEKAIKKEIKYGDSSLDYVYEDSILLPYINLNSKDADDTNKELQKTYDIAKNSFKEDENTCNYLSYKYETYVDNDKKYFSLYTTSEDVYVPGGDFVQKFEAYNFDLENGGKILNNKEILAKLNITSEDFIKKIENALIKRYNESGMADEFGTLNYYLQNSKYKDINSIKLVMQNDKNITAIFEFPCGPEGVREAILEIEL